MSFVFGLRRAALPALVSGALVLAACATAPEPERSADTAKLATQAQKLSDSNDHYVGAGMPAKQLALTFDDGPGPRTAELSTYLKNEGIRAVFFVTGACVAATTLPNASNCSAPTANAAAILTQLTADGHLVANHTTTHRDLTTIVAGADLVKEVQETDVAIRTIAKTPYNRLLLRAPFGFWNTSVKAAIEPAFSHYVGPIYWDTGGLENEYPNAAADVACWQGRLRYAANGALVDLNGAGNEGKATTTQCGDAYEAEITTADKGIVLLHDAEFDWVEGGTVRGSTVDMVKYLVPRLKAKGFAFVRADEIAMIADDFPSCGGDACALCSGPGATECSQCSGADRHLEAGSCKQCTVCPAGTFQEAACSAAADTRCTPCAPGTFADKPGSTRCVACTNCEDGNACTNDVCEASTGICRNEPIPSCVADKRPSVPFDDGDGSYFPAPESDGGCTMAARARPSIAAAFAALVGLALVRRRRR